LKYRSVPVKVGILRFQAGLVPAFISKANVAYSTGARVSEHARPYQAIGDVQDKDQYNKIHIDGQGVIGVTILKRIYLDLKAQTNITNLRKDITILGTRLNSKEKLFSYGFSLAVNVLISTSSNFSSSRKPKQVALFLFLLETL
jgi:hypothetical protein